MIKAVFFDLDGTISDTLSTIAHYGNSALVFNGLEPINEDEYKYFAGNGKKVLLKRMLEFSSSYTDEMYDKVEKKYDYEYEKNPVGFTKPFPEIPKLLTQLKAKNMKLIVLSNKPDNVTADSVSKLYPNTFDICWGKKDSYPAKPDAKSTLEIMNTLNLTANECLFIGDTYVDMETGKNAGMKTIGVLWGFRDFDELKNAGADYIISKPHEILEIILKIENEN